MKKEKGVFIGLLLIVVLIGSVSFISGDDELEGELAASKPADVSVTLANSAPTILSWTKPDYDSTNGGTFDAWPPTSCNSTTIQRISGVREGLVVTISDANGDSDLDSTASVTITVTGSVIINPACTLIAASIDGDNLADFHCPFDMEFYYEGGLSNNWVVTVTDAIDDSGSSASNAGLASDGSANRPYFNYGTLVDFEISDDNDPTAPLDTLTWSGIQATSSDVDADRYLIIQNCGNIEIDGSSSYSASDSYITVRGRDLVNSPTTDYMEPDTFFVDQIAGSCLGDMGQQLDNIDEVTDVNVVAISVLDVGIPTGASSTNSLYFCLNDINPNIYRGNDPITVDSYTTVTNKWEIDACETGCPNAVAP